MSDFWNNLEQGLRKVASHPSEKAYADDSTFYTEENGEKKGHYPMRSGPEGVEDAHHALQRLHMTKDPAERAEVKSRACAILKEHDPESYQRNCT